MDILNSIKGGRILNKRKLIVLVLVIVLIASVGIPVSMSWNDGDYNGPGKHETELYYRIRDNKNKTKDQLLPAGTVAMWNTREEFIINVEPSGNWQIAQVRIFVGTDPVPITKGGPPQIGLFPYAENFSKPVKSYKLSLNLRDEMDFAWGNRKAGEHIQNVSVYVRLVGESEDGKKVVHEDAWGYGEKEFDGGWWTRYALEKPQTGHFSNAPILGVAYDTGSQQGITNGSGAFDYIPGEFVSLRIGSLHLGTAPAKHRVSLLDLGDGNMDRAVNLARVLLTLGGDYETKEIEITETMTGYVDMAMETMDIDELNFCDTEKVDEFLDGIAAIALDQAGIVLIIATDDEAIEYLEDSVSDMFRKNISKTPDMETEKSKLELMPVYVPARKANGDPVQLAYKDADGELISTRSEAKPLVVVYADEIPDADGAMDVFAAISRDEGNTWKVTNLSRSAAKSSFTLANGYQYPGDVKKPNIKVQDNKIMVIWTSRYAHSGKPAYAIDPNDDYPYDDPYYEEDIWGVSGPQLSTDYTDQGFPEVGELPYYCVWTCRGTVCPETGDITWFKAERLTSGRRDAYQVMVNGAKNAGFGLVWQEDPKGVRPGDMAGPGHGWSGATTNHKTDVWYSYIGWDDFDIIDDNFVSGGDPQHDEDKEESGRPKALVPFSLPVRVSDNDTLNADNMKLVVDENGPVKDENGNWVVDADATGGAKEGKCDEDKNLGSGDCGSGSGNGKSDSDKDSLGSHAYGYTIPGLCADFYQKSNPKGDVKWVAITEDGCLMDGDTGASRPNIMMQPYQKTDGTYDAWVMVIYEETKGVGSGPPEHCHENEDMTALSGDNDGSGDHKGADEYVPDKGKNVIYHSFTMTDPDLVSAGTILNPQSVDEEGNPLFLVDEEGQPIYDWDGSEIPAYENARRPRLIVQSKKNALDAVKAGEDATVMVTVFKMGEEGKGRPSDIFMRRWVVVKDANDPSNSGNPYRPGNLVDGWQNISSITPTETWINPDSTSAQDPDKEPLKVVRWEQTEENLADFSGDNPYDDARSHRGFIKGNFLAIAYDWTPNWAAARNGNDVYNLYLRRSFDGGATWTTNPDGEGVWHHDTFKIYPEGEGTEGNKEKEVVSTFYEAGEFEPARNLSQVTNTKETIIEPRLVGVPGTILTDGQIKYPEDEQQPNAFWLTYGTHSNPGRKSEEEGIPLDLFYSYSVDYGDEFYEVEKTIKGEGNNTGEVVTVWDWLAKDTGKYTAEQAECQIRMTPDGSIFYAVWNETGDKGSDCMFRRIMRDGGSIEVVE